MEEQTFEKKTILSSMKSFGVECWRVLKITKKPTMDEYKMTLMITGLGILVIGFIGFVITMIKQLIIFSK
jgi:protein transport protein SEC61 subunit gamma-like protein